MDLDNKQGGNPARTMGVSVAFSTGCSPFEWHFQKGWHFPVDFHWTCQWHFPPDCKFSELWRAIFYHGRASREAPVPAASRRRCREWGGLTEAGAKMAAAKLVLTETLSLTMLLLRPFKCYSQDH